MSFQWPFALLALALLPLVVVAYVERERRRTQFAARWGTPALLPNLVDRSPRRLRHVPLVVLLVALAAMIVGVARPHATVHVKREQATVLLAIDTSRSMGAKDVQPTRLAAAKAAATEFVAKVPKKFRIGIVSFASRAVVTLAPTENRSLVAPALAALHPGEGTALGDAVVLAANLGRRQRTSEGKVPPMSLLVISDGARDGGRTSPQIAAQRARKLHLPVSAVLVGTANGVVEHALPGGFRETIRVPPSPTTLRQLTRATGGEFFTATDDAGLRKVYEQLGSRLGKRKESREITDLFAGGSALLLFAGGAMSALWFRRVP
jgi:Ca-activated chloride channel family protein